MSHGRTKSLANNTKIQSKNTTIFIEKRSGLRTTRVSRVDNRLSKAVVSPNKLPVLNAVCDTKPATNKLNEITTAYGVSNRFSALV